MKLSQKLHIIKSIIKRGEFVLNLPRELFYCERDEFGILPTFCYGYAYHRRNHNVIVYVLIPFNYLIKGYHNFRYWYSRFQCKPSWADKIISKRINIIRRKMFESYIHKNLHEKEMRHLKECYDDQVLQYKMKIEVLQGRIDA